MTERIGDQSGSGKVAGEGRKEEAGSQKSKDDEGGSVRFSEKPVHHRPRILEAGLNLTDVRKVHLAVAFCLHLRSRVFVKAACGKTARAV